MPTSHVARIGTAAPLVGAVAFSTGRSDDGGGPNLFPLEKTASARLVPPMGGGGGPQQLRRLLIASAMHAVAGRRGLLLAAGLGLLAACGAGDRQAPGTADLVIEKALTNSGDRQVGVAGEPLAQDFRALVTRDGEPAGGVTVYWTWPVGSAGHNIVPDDGNLPATSGAPTGHPKFLSFRFMSPGVFHYHCAVHGGPGGVGMSGSVAVPPLPPTG